MIANLDQGSWGSSVDDNVRTVNPHSKQFPVFIRKIKGLAGGDLPKVRGTANPGIPIFYFYGILPLIDEPNRVIGVVLGWQVGGCPRKTSEDQGQGEQVWFHGR